MKIIITHDQYKKKGGVERYLLDLVDGFIKAGDQVTLLVYKVDPNLPVPGGCTLHKLPVAHVPRTLRRFALSLLATRYLRRKPHDLSISLSYAAHHDIILTNNACTVRGDRRKWWLKQRIKNACELYAMKTCRYVMTHSKQVKDEISVHHAFLKDKVHCLYPPINTDVFSMAYRKKREDYRREFGIKPNQYALVFPSTGHRRKGLPLLLEAIKQLPADQFIVLIAGDSPSAYQADRRSEVVRYCGFVDDMATLYVAADATVLPSHHEPFGLVVIESIECGTPVVISNRVGARELTSSNCGIVLPDLTVAALVSTLQPLPNQSFSIQPYFAKRHGLTISQHIRALKECLGEGGN